MWKVEIREVLPSLFLVINSVTWFSLTWFAIRDQLVGSSFNTILVVSFSYFGALILSAIVGATLLQKKLRTKTPLLLWVLLGAAACMLSTILAPEKNSINLVFVALPLGFLSGLGIPSCLGFFAEAAKIKRRGIIGAVMFFVIQGFTVLIYVPISSVTIDHQFLVLGVWRLLAAASVLFFRPQEKLDGESITSLSKIIRERTFFLYLVPWFLFTVVNFVEQPLLENYFGAELYSTYTLALILIFSVSAFLGGAICDFKGRKVAGISGFILLGLGYAFLSLLPGTAVSQIMYVLFDGVAWGILYVTFIFVVWGDISEEKSRERYYLLGCMPFLFSNLIEALVKPFAEAIPIETSFSFASLFLFLAILPLLYAPETLSEKIMKDRELNNYIAKAQKEVAKAQNKEDESEQCENNDEDEPVEFKVNQEDDEKARELAEKYY